MDDDSGIEELLDGVIERTVGALRAMTNQGFTPHQTLSMLMSAHMAHITTHNMMDTAAGYAAALYRLAVYKVRISELQDQVAMLTTLDEIRDL